MGDWSIPMTLSTHSIPCTSSHWPGRLRAPFMAAARVLYRISFTRVDLPEPDTPVTQIILPRGKSTVMSRRLFSRALTTRRNLPLPSRRCWGTSTYLRPDRYCPVMLRLDLQISATLPAATISPPCTPAPGPTSTRKSAWRIVSSSCSTTMRVLPRSRRRFMVAMSLSLSRWCRPMLGSSSTYSTPVRALPIWVARRIRWLSPPERDAAPRERVRYPRPTLCKKPRRSFTSLKMGAPIISSRSETLAVLMNSSSSCTLISQKSAILMPPTVTARLAGFRRRPWQVGHSSLDMTRAISSLTHSLPVSRKRRSRLGTMPSNSL